MFLNYRMCLSNSIKNAFENKSHQDQSLVLKLLIDDRFGTIAGTMILTVQTSFNFRNRSLVPDIVIISD